MFLTKTSTPSTVIRFTFGAFALSLLTLGCDPASEPVGDEELLAEEAEAEDDDVDALTDEAEPPPAGAADGPAPVSSRDPGFDLVAQPDVAAYEWGTWFSEEDPGSTCRSGSLVTGVECSGWYCDSMRLECHPGSVTNGQRTWSPWFSEEGNNWWICDGTGFISGMTCSGGYCDNISVECTITNSTPGIHTCIWSPYYSDTTPQFLAPGGYAVKGVQCAGLNCASKRYYYCPV